jgi:hypothetical protein
VPTTRWLKGIIGLPNVLTITLLEKNPATRALPSPTLRIPCGTIAGTTASGPQSGVAALERGEAGHAMELHEASLGLYEALQDKAGQAFALINLGDVARLLGDEGRAVSLYEEALVLHGELGNDRGISRALERLGAQEG